MFSHNKIRKKKGVLFTIIAISLLALSLFYISYSYSYHKRMGTIAISSRIDSMNNFVKDVEKDLRRELYISSFRTLLGLEEYIASQGRFLNNTEESFREVFLFGKLGNESISIMENTTFVNWTEKVRRRALELMINVNITLNNISINQSDPWSVDVSINTSVFIQDLNNLASWNKTILKTVKVSIIGFEDPLYVVNSYGKITNVINRTPYTYFVLNNNTENLLNHLNNSYYIESTTAPSFLMRFSNNLSSSPQGIESLVNLNEFISKGIPIETKSVVDYIYFSNRTTTDLCVDNSIADPDLPSWFRLDTDDNHHIIYEITTINKTCS